MQFTIEKFEKRSFSSMFNGAKFCWFAVVLIGDSRLGFSMLEGEREFLADSLFRKGLPVWVHGIGSRCCLKQKAAPLLANALEEKRAELEKAIEA